MLGTIFTAICLDFLPAAHAQSSTTPNCVPSKFRVAIDVGHTPETPGATSSRGQTEYSFNLALASEITNRLKAEGYDASLIRVHGIGVDQLVNRTQQVNALQPRLVLSIHHDATQPRYLQKWSPGGTALNFSDRFSGFSLFVSRLNVHPADSLKFAELLSSALTSHGLVFSSHHSENIGGERRRWANASKGIYYYDDLFLLQHASAPAVLLEAGLIVNRIEELVLGSAAGRDTIASAATSAVQAYCASTPR
jgi:N-acetylmuramoyl-L-alanine amidase